MLTMCLHESRVLNFLKTKLALLKDNVILPQAHTPCVVVLKYVHHFLDT